MTPRQQVIELAERYKQIEIDFKKANKFAKIKLLAEIANIANKIFQLGYSLPELIYKRQLKDTQNANDQSLENPPAEINRRR